MVKQGVKAPQAQRAKPRTRRWLIAFLSAGLGLVIILALATLSPLPGGPNFFINLVGGKKDNREANRADALSAAQGFLKGLNDGNESEANRFASDEFGRSTRDFLAFYRTIKFDVDGMRNYELSRDPLALLAPKPALPHLREDVKRGRTFIFTGRAELRGRKHLFGLVVVRQGNAWKVGFGTVRTIDPG